MKLFLKIRMPIILIYFLSIFFCCFYTSTALSTICPAKKAEDIIKKNTPLLKNELKILQLELGSPVFIRIFKETAILQLWIKGKTEYVLFRNYDICSLRRIPGPKLKKGDYKSPEGFYFVGPTQLNPNSHYHLSFDIGYPNEYDRYYKRTGSAIMVHGRCASNGCFAMRDPVIEQIYTLLDAAFKNGQKNVQVHIFPFYMTEKNMERHKNSEWTQFWKNLKEGYDYFEKNKVPPDVKSKNGVYLFK